MHDCEIVIVGAGPAGIGMGIVLKKLGFESFAILEKDRAGASFNLWPEEMKLITPSFTGQGFGALDLNAVAPGTSPAFTFQREHLSGSEYAEYLSLLADHFQLPLVEGAAVRKVHKDDAGFLLETDQGKIKAKAVIWGAGEFQFPKHSFPGAELGLHNSKVTAWSQLEKAHYYVVGGYESAMDAAFQLAEYGSDVTVIMPNSIKENAEADPSLSLSPYTWERIEAAYQKEKVQFLEHAKVEKMTKKGCSAYDLYLANGRKIRSDTRPIIATGFHSGAKQIEHLFEWAENGKPLLTEADMSTITDDLYLIGPSVQHQKAVFCFIYKFRQRFAVIAEHLLKKLGYPPDEKVLSEYRENQMFLTDLSCCEVHCEC
ncbi:NAD(P)-binding domain-containing protein [Bacillus swezeyi]|uniref:NAD(P)/FAD-dependent oxidoreductase n=1 Tax=Bacillus swezeyi TaxID=1925020 RepID=UPI0009FB8A76|nr:NAD(P)/FAD-dependent oxidoreductase [Bacillus swezeyi]MEC1261312.1 NAD(P)-binding domain-containing protein [Bacillus swezeyi]MED2963756.1 NAD(P)-binding domain-containing protein [Bacillus swezeyi]